MQKIPKQFQIFGNTIRVEIRENLYEEAECHGRWVPRKNLIEIQGPTPTHAVAQDFLLATFWHEVIHAIAECCNLNKLNNNEKHVELIGQAIAQVLKTKTGSHG